MPRRKTAAAAIALLGLWAQTAAAEVLREFTLDQPLNFALPPSSPDFPSTATVSGILGIDVTNGTIAVSGLTLNGSTTAANTFSRVLSLTGDGIGAGVFASLLTPGGANELDLYILGPNGAAQSSLIGFTGGTIGTSAFNPRFSSLSLSAFDTAESLLGNATLSLFTPIVIHPINFPTDVPEPAAAALAATALAALALTRRTPIRRPTRA